MPLTWTGVTGINHNWESICVSPTGRIVACGGDSVGSVMTSDDGLIWTAQANIGKRIVDKGLIWDGTQFCAFARTTDVYTSADGVAWVKHTGPDITGLSLIKGGIAVGAGVYVLVYGNGGCKVAYSADLTSWTILSPPLITTPASVIYDGSQFVAVGFGTIPIMTATDPTAVAPAVGGWTGQMGFSVGFQNTLWVSVAVGSGGYKAVGTGLNGVGAVMSSADGVTWTLDAGVPTFFGGVPPATQGWKQILHQTSIGWLAVAEVDSGNATEGSMNLPASGGGWAFIATPDQNPPNDVSGRWTCLCYSSFLGLFIAADFGFGGQLYAIMTQVAVVSVWYYNPTTNHFQYSATDPGAPWIPQNPVLSIDCAGISPNTGLTVGGSLITIPGTGFGDGATVTFGGVAGTSVTVFDANTITVILPAHAAGAVDVVVTNPDGTTFTCHNGFTYLTPTTINFTGADLSLTQGQPGPGGPPDGWVTKQCTGRTGSPRTGV